MLGAPHGAYRVAADLADFQRPVRRVARALGFAETEGKAPQEHLFAKMDMTAAIAGIAASGETADPPSGSKSARNQTLRGWILM
jgi:hypothetical protein